MEKMEALQSLAEMLDSASFSLNLGGGLGIVAYVLTAWALFVVAKRRGLSSPWMAWVPIVNAWTLGAISDQYRLAVKGQKKNKRKWLLGLSIASNVLVILMVIWIVVLVLMGFDAIPSEPDSIEEVVEGLLPEILGGLLAGIPIILALAGVAIAGAVLNWMAMWDVFQSCDKANAQKYFLISILTTVFGISGFESAFLFAVKDKDDGMIRKSEPILPGEQE